MMHFLMNCLQPDAVLMLFVAASCFIGFRFNPREYVWLIWIFIGILAIVSWVLLVFGG